MGAKDNHDEVFAPPGTHRLPTPASGHHVDPFSPVKGAKSDTSVATDASNADKGSDETSYLAETPRTITAAAIAKLKITTESEDSEVSAEVAQLQALGISKDDDRDKNYVPTTPSGRSRKGKPPSRTPRAPRPSMVVVLRAPPEELLRISRRPARIAEIPIGDTCFLFRLPLEVRRQVWRHLLLAARPIQVMNGWSQMYRWQQLDLHPAVLAASRAVFGEAVRVLYAENDFRYLVRDRAGLPGRKVDHSRGRGHGGRSCRRYRTLPGDQSNPCTIDVAKYGRYFRRLELRVERNRMTAEYDGVLARALGILIGVGVELHRLTVDVSPRPQLYDFFDDDDDTGDEASASMSDWFHPEGEVSAALKALDTSFIHIHVFHGVWNKSAPWGLRCIVDKRREVSVLEVLQACDQQRHQQHQQQRDGGGGPGQPGVVVLSREDMRRSIQAYQAKAADRQLEKLHLRIEGACRDPDAAVRKGWFEPFEAEREWRRGGRRL